tara:strand:+ start:377 stop:718 length:342 start_codon:yes stop_codon:yes gene_type:complete
MEATNYATGKSLLCIAGTEEGAEMYAINALEEDTMMYDVDESQNKPVILVLDGDVLQANGKLLPDYDDLWNAFRNGEIPVPPTEMGWIESLKWGDTAAFQGSFGSAIKEKLIW